MNFDIAQTPVLQAIATGDEHKLIEDLQKRLEIAVKQADMQPEVIAAERVQQQSAEVLRKLRIAERALHRHAREMTDKLGPLRASAFDRLIETCADENKPDYQALLDLSEQELRGKQVSQAIQRLVEHRIPLAQIRALREESHAMMTRVRALEQIAQERAEKLMEQLRGAVSEEVVLPVDLSKGVSGALLQQAAEYKHRAIQLAENADVIEKAWLSRTRNEDYK